MHLVMDSFVVNVLVHDVLDFDLEFENLGVVMEEVRHVDSIDLVVVNNTVDHDHEAAVAVEVADDHNSMVDRNVEVVVGIEEEVVHSDEVHCLDDEYLDYEADDLHMDIAVVDYQSDETDDDAVAVDRVVVEDVNNTAALILDCNTDWVVVDNVHYYEVHHAAVETAAVLDKDK